MKCTKCQFENQEGVKFCIECGTPMEFHCPKCNAKTPATGKFCGECGHDLRKPSEALPEERYYEKKIEKIQKYLPNGLTDKILSQRDRNEGEREQVPVIISYMEGFTTFFDKVCPEDAHSTIGEASVGKSRVSDEGRRMS